jgi:uncharacterized membrane protein YsdA (DUF1294 family)/cold shock CspA family protein
MSKTMAHGVVVRFDPQAGFGFVRSSAFTEDVFVHVSAVTDGRALQLGQRVRFSAEPSEKGLRAVRVELGGMGLTPAALGAPGVIGALGLLATSLWCLGLSWLWAWLGATNLVTPVAYAIDKHQAVRGRRRIPEVVLLSLALIGGTPAAVLSLLLLRHKTRKGSFLLGLASVVAIQVLGFVIWLIAS